jgi:hypothetical protein
MGYPQVIEQDSQRRGERPSSCAVSHTNRDGGSQRRRDYVVAGEFLGKRTTATAPVSQSVGHTDNWGGGKITRKAWSSGSCKESNDT